MTDRSRLPAAAFVGVGAVAVTAIACLRPATARWFWFAGPEVEIAINLWLGLRLWRATWCAAAVEPRVVAWIRDAGPGSWGRLVACGPALGRSWLFVGVVAGLAAWLLRAPLTPFGAVVLGLGLASPAHGFELVAGWVASWSTRWRRALRAVMVASVVGWLGVWAWDGVARGFLPAHPQAVLPRLVMGELWGWLLPARWATDLVEDLGTLRPVAGSLLPLLATGLVPSTAFVAVPIWRKRIG